MVIAAAVSALLLGGCMTSSPPPDAAVTNCLSQYHVTAPDPVASLSSLKTVIYAPACTAFKSIGSLSWAIGVVAQDDITIRIYFIGGVKEDRCDLLRTVSVTESQSVVTVRLEGGSDPTLKSSACSAVGQMYVTGIKLRAPLSGRRLEGPPDAHVEHL